MLDVGIDADFADLDEIVAGERQQTAPVERDWKPEEAGAGTLALRYRHPRLDHATMLTFRGADAVADDGRAVHVTLALEPQRSRLVTIDIGLRFLGQTVRPWNTVDGETFGSRS